MLKPYSEKTYVVLSTSKHNGLQMENVTVGVRDSNKCEKPGYCLRLVDQYFNSVCGSGYHHPGNNSPITRYLITDAIQSLFNGCLASRHEYRIALQNELQKKQLINYNVCKTKRQ